MSLMESFEDSVLEYLEELLEPETDHNETYIQMFISGNPTLEQKIENVRKAISEMEEHIESMDLDIWELSGKEKEMKPIELDEINNAIEALKPWAEHDDFEFCKALKEQLEEMNQVIINAQTELNEYMNGSSPGWEGLPDIYEAEQSFTILEEIREVFPR